MKTADVTIFSTLKRGLWLSNHLAQVQQKKVVFVDLLSEDFPHENTEGPFGFFQSSQMNFFQQEWWKSQWTPCDQGFSILSEDQFFHFKSIFLNSVYQKRKDYRTLQELEFQKNTKKRKIPFKEGWMAHLAQSLSHCVEQTYFSNSQKPTPLPFFQDFGVLSFFEPCSSLLHQDVFYQSHKRFDFQIKKRKKDYLILNNREIIARTQKIIWMLSPSETHQANPLLSHFLYGKEVPISHYWQKFSFHFNFENYPFPNYFVCANPSNLPWIYENLISAKKDLRFKNQLNAWVKIPLNALLNLEELGQKIKEKFLHLFPYSECELKKEKRLSFPFVFSTYDSKQFKKIEFNSDPNIFLAWPYWDMSRNGWTQQEASIAVQLNSKKSSRS